MKLVEFPKDEHLKSVVSVAALLHDVDDYKVTKTTNNQNARDILHVLNFSEEFIDEVVSTINSVSWTKNRGQSPTTVGGQIVQDADRLDAIGAIGVARVFAYGGANNRTIEQSIQHFYEKLLKLKDHMNTDTGKMLAEQRHAFLLQFLKQYRGEIY